MVCKSNYESACKEGKCSTLGFPFDETNRQNWLRNIPRHFDTITRNIRVCIKRFEEKNVHTFDLQLRHEKFPECVLRQRLLL